jgi:hypothetical protein
MLLKRSSDADLRREMDLDGRTLAVGLRKRRITLADHLAEVRRVLFVAPRERRSDLYWMWAVALKRNGQVDAALRAARKSLNMRPPTEMDRVDESLRQKMRNALRGRRR